jgi:iron complex outermembrane receptor protein
MSDCRARSAQFGHFVKQHRCVMHAAELSAALLVAFLPVMAVAQAPGSVEANAAQPSELQEITVTARRRSEDISNVPISITALDPNQLTEREVHTESDLQVSVPGLIVRTTAVSTQQNYSLRGQSIDAFTGSSPAVLAYVNEVEANTGAPTTFFDLSSIQVLKGPQGTLFGRNTTGGAVLYTTAKPDATFGGFVTERVGNLDLTDTTAAVNLPASDKVLLRLAGDFYQRGGFQHDVATNQDFGGLIRRAGRATLVLKLIENLENVTVYEYGSSSGHPTINTLFSYYPCGSKGLVTSGACLFSPLVDSTIGFPGAWATYLAAHPGINPGGIPAVLARQQQLGIWGVDSPQPNALRQQNWSVSNTTTYSLTDTVQLKNIFGASRSFTDFIADQLGVPYGISLDYNTATGLQGNKTTLRNYSDEVQLLGKTLEAQLDYVVGFYYADDRHTERDDLSYFDLSPVIPPAPSTFTFVATSKSEAAYAQATYDLSSLSHVSGLKVTGGFRYTWETDGLSYPFDPLPPAKGGALLSGQPSESKRFSDPSWQIGLDYQISPQLLLYIVHRGSWRSGGFNGYSPSNPTTAQFNGNEFLPEKTHDVELGAKFRGDVLSVPSVFNIALYNQWITDIQRVIYTFAGTNVSAFTGNIPAGQVRGVEIDGEISPVAALTMGLSGAYTDAFYTNGTGVAYGGGLLHYGPVGDVSRLSGSVFAQANLPTPKAWGAMSVRGELYAQSYEYFSNLNSTITPGTRLPGYGVLNLRYDWHGVFGTGLTVSGFAKNVLNHGYYTGGESFGADFGLNAAAPAEPRTYGAELTYRF